MSHVKQSLMPVHFTNVRIEDKFWSPRIRMNREQTIPYQYEQLKATGRIDAFKLDWKRGDEPVPHNFWDSDVAKWIEASSYSLAKNPDPELDSLIDEVISLIRSAQQSDGYLNIRFTVVEPGQRWTNLIGAHELYCAGHFIEAGVAHYQATEKNTLIDIVTRYADYIASVFGPEEGKKKGYPGHEEIELALVKLFNVTGNERYLNLSRFFVDERGTDPHYFDMEKEKYGISTYYKVFNKPKEYNQSHKPVREQDKVVGHAVRAMYLYSAMADLARETGDKSLFTACKRLWNNLHEKNLYITGGIGQTHEIEGFTFDYDLPNETAYAETCAAVGLVFWAHRMLELDCDRQYADVMERALYNGVMSGVSLDGKKFFYENPLSSLGDVHREEWFDCACCPPNLARLLASLGEYVYAQDDDTAVVHLYIQGNGEFHINGQHVILKQESDYPWEGDISLSFELQHSDVFGLKLRIPEWCRGANLKVNGELIDINRNLEKGYVFLKRKWANHDKLELKLPMPVDRVYSHPSVRQNINHVSLQRGPLVYCLEETDNKKELHNVYIPETANLEANFDQELLEGIKKIEGYAYIPEETEWDARLYRSNKPEMKPFYFTAVPYYLWDNRVSGEMRVWMPECEDRNMGL